VSCCADGAARDRFGDSGQCLRRRFERGSLAVAKVTLKRRRLRSCFGSGEGRQLGGVYRKQESRLLWARSVDEALARTCYGRGEQANRRRGGFAGITWLLWSNTTKEM
jgi:hypothetical protein